jgi:hypothetical protein
MPCPDFKGKDILFLSGELKKSDRIRYLRHLKQCDECQKVLDDTRQMWNQISKLPDAEPSQNVRSRILNEAKRHVEGKRSANKKIVRIRYWTPNPKLVWTFSTVFGVALLLIMIYIFVRPVQLDMTDPSDTEPNLAWQDDFLSEAAFLDSEIDRIDSGQLLVNYFSEDEQGGEWKDQLSTMSDDLDWIRSEIDNLMENLFGI